MVPEKLFVFDHELQVVLEDSISFVDPVHRAETAELARFISRGDERAGESVTESLSKRRGISRESAARILIRFEIATSVENAECQDFIRRQIIEARLPDVGGFLSGDSADVVYRKRRAGHGVCDLRPEILFQPTARLDGLGPANGSIRIQVWHRVEMRDCPESIRLAMEFCGVLLVSHTRLGKFAVAFRESALITSVDTADGAKWQTQRT